MMRVWQDRISEQKAATDRLPEYANAPSAADHFRELKDEIDRREAE
jgi:hypothetical protein